jgi:hypothetical protein
VLDGKFCAACQKKGHLCPAASVVDGVGECAFCQDGEECPVSKREKEVAERFGKAAAGRAAVAVAPEKVKVQRAPQQTKEEKTMDGKMCACGCGNPAPKKWNYLRGHKPEGAKSAPKSEATPPPQNGCQTRAREVHHAEAARTSGSSGRQRRRRSGDDLRAGSGSRSLLDRVERRGESHSIHPVLGARVAA